MRGRVAGKAGARGVQWLIHNMYHVSIIDILLTFFWQNEEYLHLKSVCILLHSLIVWSVTTLCFLIHAHGEMRSSHH